MPWVQQADRQVTAVYGSGELNSCQFKCGGVSGELQTPAAALSAHGLLFNSRAVFFISEAIDT
jgi:hypothetical protein